MSDLISVIVPIYNVEKYLDKCIECLVNQTHKNLEIILVDDGSPDNSPSICDKWAQKDNRIQVIHKKNGGVSSARNAGLDAALGDYIGFLDADDYVDADMYEVMLREILENHADAAGCGMVRESPNGYKEVWANDTMSVVDKIGVLKLVGEAVGILPVHTGNKLFSKKVVSNVRFDARFKFAEDTLFNFQAACNMDKMVIHNVARYHYNNNFDSVSHQKFVIAKLDEHKVMDIIFEYAQGNDELMKYCVKGDVLKCFRTIKEMCMEQNHMQYFDEIRKRIITHKNEILKTDFYSKGTKVKTLMLWLAPRFYKVFIRAYGIRADKKYGKAAGVGNA